MHKESTLVSPGSFNNEHHWYAKAQNATIHPMVNYFLNLDQRRIVSRYCHLHPRVNRERLVQLLSYRSKFFLWSGADLFNATSADGNRQMVVIENNSCPSGQKSMPLLDDNKEEGTYRDLIERTFVPFVKTKRGEPKIDGGLAVIYDKNHMESSAYAAIIADVFNENVVLVPSLHGEGPERIKILDGLVHVHHDNEWQPVRAIFRYLTQKPWNRLPIHSKTKILNPIVACLAGGRNKMVAAKAYDLFNSELKSYGLSINAPETIWDISKEEIPLWVKKMGGHAVVKIPYSNAGQGVFTITNESELNDFMSTEIDYQRYIVQSLIGNYNWSSKGTRGKFYHVGTMPSKNGSTYVADIRMMVSSTAEGIKPLCIYSRRAAVPLTENLDQSQQSWSMLGTNLSIKTGENEWDSDTSRLMLMDRRDFNKLGLGLDDLIEAFIQTTLSTIAIDQMCQKLFNSKGRFRMKLFKSLNNDSKLLEEILQ
ncbi:MAG: hypothetical protein HKN87_08740 [Saprospiraceae bacterium]|nr:hypothetical protein [Saprospiraceae bacterium]